MRERCDRAVGVVEESDATTTYTSGTTGWTGQVIGGPLWETGLGLVMTGLHHDVEERSSGKGGVESREADHVLPGAALRSREGRGIPVDEGEGRCGSDRTSSRGVSH